MSLQLPRPAEKIMPLDRTSQRFPTLSPTQLESVRRFARQGERSFGPLELMTGPRDSSAPAWFLAAGSAEMFFRDGLGKETVLQALHPGQFTGELHQLARGPLFLGARAGPEGCVALPFDQEPLRSLIVGSADVGELVMRAFILRRMMLLEAGAGPVVIGQHGSPSLTRLQAFLTRNGYPHITVDAASESGSQLVRGLDAVEGDLPILLCPCGRLLRRPTNEEAGVWLRITPALPPEAIYDVAVIGAGPAGLATAVYAASEGLSVLVVERDVVGGQAGASMRIENYLGFPAGISGLSLTGRAIYQAQKFGALVATPLAATAIAAASPSKMEVRLAGGQSAFARSVVVATGARYRRPPVPNHAEFEGAGLHYWASPVEAGLCRGSDAVLVGAGNSAGQAAVFLAPYVKRLHLMVRGASLEVSMSQYLVSRIRMLDNVDVQFRVELTELHGDRATGLRAATFRERESGSEQRIETCHVFMFIGAEPNTAWLGGCVELDPRGYVRTGSAVCDRVIAWTMQTSLPRVFAIGDVRSGSTKRVASAVGEGAAVVAQLHQMLGAKRASAG
jgi:thioredoxin reductase (NADPH)